MSETQIANEDPFYKEVPKHLWLTISNCNDEKRLEVILELNEKKKVIYSTPFFTGDGIVLQSTNLTWLLPKDLK